MKPEFTHFNDSFINQSPKAIERAKREGRTNQVSVKEMINMGTQYDSEADQFYNYLDDEEDDEREKWTCAFPERCLMPGEHMRSECHTVEMLEAE
jgi:hypothetical protein